MTVITLKVWNNLGENWYLKNIEFHNPFFIYLGFLSFSLAMFYSFNVEVFHVLLNSLPAFLFYHCYYKYNCILNFIFQFFLPLYKIQLILYNDPISCHIGNLFIISNYCFVSFWYFLCKQTHPLKIEIVILFLFRLHAFFYFFLIYWTTVR